MTFCFIEGHLPSSFPGFECSDVILYFSSTRPINYCHDVTCMRACVYVCVRACVRACVRVCVLKFECI